MGVLGGACQQLKTSVSRSRMARSLISLLLLCIVASQVEGRGRGGGRNGESLFPGVRGPWDIVLAVILGLFAFGFSISCLYCFCNCCCQAIGIDTDGPAFHRTREMNRMKARIEDLESRVPLQNR